MVLLVVLIPPIYFTVCFVGLLALYTWRGFIDVPKWSRGKDRERSPCDDDVVVGECWQAHLSSGCEASTCWLGRILVRRSLAELQE